MTGSRRDICPGLSGRKGLGALENTHENALQRVSRLADKSRASDPASSLMFCVRGYQVD